MNTLKIKINTMVKSLIAVSAVLFLTACSQDEFIEKPVAEAEQFAVAEVVRESDVASVTISGIYADVIETLDCTTCTYTVPEDVAVVDGEKLKLKPGSVICLGNGRKLGEVEFLNIVGTEDRPIVIGTCE